MADPYNDRSAAASVLDKDITVTGTIHSDGAIRIEGAVEGDVHARAVTLTASARVKGNVEAETATLEGRLEGSLSAKEVRIAETGRMEGDVVHSVLVVESGAHLEGQCKRLSEGAGRAAPRPAADSAPKDSGAKDSGARESGKGQGKPAAAPAEGQKAPATA